MTTHMDAALVLGLGYGDEGKGLVTDYLCAGKRRPLVVRFSGGHQAGHTVVQPDGRRHVFSHVGSGTLRGAATYWSRWCTLYPTALASEAAALRALGVRPRLYVDNLAPVTTPYDVAYNRWRERKLGHGSCGVGFGATVARQAHTPYRLYALDLWYPAVWHTKLAAIADYYHQLTAGELTLEPDALEAFALAVSAVTSQLAKPVAEAAFFAGLDTRFDALVWEGSQGILLDMDHGFFPHVTHAHTTSRQAMALTATYGLPLPTVHYVSRAYQTRHGNGPLTNAHLEPELHPTPDETNQYNPWQGSQRRALLDVDLLAYALAIDANYCPHAAARRLVVTCLDQLAGPWQATAAGQTLTLADPAALGSLLGFGPHEVLASAGPTAETMGALSVNQHSLSTLNPMYV